MFIETIYDKKKVWLNTEDIMDVFDEGGPVVKAYTIDENRGAYFIDRERWLGFLSLVNAYECKEMELVEEDLKDNNFIEIR